MRIAGVSLPGRGLRYVIVLVLLAAALASPGARLHADERFTLPAVEADIARRFPDVRHMTPEELATVLSSAGRGEIVLFDVREEAEYAVSHLPGAVRVEPGIWRWSFMSRHKDALAGKTVVFYCSVGERSTRLASAVKAVALEAGAREVVNLRGGIFAWVNGRRDTVDSAGPTRDVHPYDRTWGRLVDDAGRIRTEPRK